MVNIKKLPIQVRNNIANLQTLSEIGSGSAQVDEIITDALDSIGYILQNCSIDNALKIKYNAQKIQTALVSGEQP